MVDAEKTGGHCVRGIGAGAGEERPNLVVVQDPFDSRCSGNLYLVCAFDVHRRSKVAADPDGQATSDRQHRPVEGLQGLTIEEELAPVRGKEGVGNAHLEVESLAPLSPEGNQNSLSNENHPQNGDIREHTLSTLPRYV